MSQCINTKRISLFFLSFSLFFLCFYGPLLGSPRTIRFQGRLTDNVGSPISGTPLVRFEFFDAAENGTSVWGPKESVVDTNANGLFSEDLGPFSDGDIEKFKQANNLFIEVSIQPTSGNWQAMKPRQPLGTVPFAMFADRADRADQAGSIDDNSITSDKIVDGEVKTNDIGSEAVESQNIKEGAIGNTLLAPDAVQSNSIKNESILAEDLAPEAADNRVIANQSVDQEKLAPGAVEARHITENAISETHLQPNAVTSVIIQEGTIQSGDIGEAQIQEPHFLGGAVSARALAIGAVSETHLTPDLIDKLLPKGLIALFDGVCPPGWGRYSNLDNRFPMGSPSSGNEGGTSTHQHPIAPDAQHNHSGETSGANRGPIKIVGTPPGAPPGDYLEDVANQFTERSSPHTHVIAPVENHSHTGMTGDINHLPPYRKMLFCVKN